MIDVLPWVKLPSAWIENRGLKKFRWKAGQGAAETCALMTLLAIAHRASPETATTRLTYDDLMLATNASRARIADGLELLEKRKLIERAPEGRSTFRLANFNPDRDWCMIPAKRLYAAGNITGLRDFTLRRNTELDALKAYLAFAARRDRTYNRAHMTYKQIREYTGIPEERIKSAVSLLVVNNLVLVDQQQKPDVGVSYAYRLRYLMPRVHHGTTAKAQPPAMPMPDSNPIDRETANALEAFAKGDISLPS